MKRRRLGQWSTIQDKSSPRYKLRTKYYQTSTLTTF